MRIITKAELARWAGVSTAAIAQACRSGGKLFDCSSSAGIDVDHPLAREFLAKHGMHKLPSHSPTENKRKKPRPGAGRKPKVKVLPETEQPKPDPSPKADTVKPSAQKPQPQPDEPKAPKPEPAPKLDPIARDIPQGHEIQDLELLTVREVTMRYGSMDGFKRYVESLKNIAEYKHRELRVRQQRGELIERSRVAGVIFPTVDVAFSRLVSDVPESVSKLVVARVESGGPDTRTDVLAIIRDANSRVLKNLKQSLLEIEELRDV